MSRVGKPPVPLPDGVTARVDGREVWVKGPKGELSAVLPEGVGVSLEDGTLKVTAEGGAKDARAMWGLSRTLVQNLVTGVTQAFERRLEIRGIGYRAQMSGNTLTLALGLSHEVTFAAPEGVNIEVASPTEIVVRGIDKQRVGQVAADLRRLRPPEHYKGKGVRYAGEFVPLKATVRK